MEAGPRKLRLDKTAYRDRKKGIIVKSRSTQRERGREDSSKRLEGTIKQYCPHDDDPHKRHLGYE